MGSGFYISIGIVIGALVQMAIEAIYTRLRARYRHKLLDEPTEVAIDKLDEQLQLNIDFMTHWLYKPVYCPSLHITPRMIVTAIDYRTIRDDGHAIVTCEWFDAQLHQHEAAFATEVLAVITEGELQ